MPLLQDIRNSSPEFQNFSDKQIAEAVYESSPEYQNYSFDEFSDAIGYQEPSILSDTGALIKSGLLQSVAGIHEMIGINDVPAIQNEINKTVSGMNPVTQDALSQELTRSNPDNFFGTEFTEAARNPSAWGTKAIQQIGVQAPMMVAGGGLTYGLKGAGGLLGGAVGKTAQAIAPAIGYGTGETLVTAGGAGINVRDMISNIPDEKIRESQPFQQEYWNLRDSGLDHDQAFDNAKKIITENAVSEAKKNVSPFTFLFGAAMGPVYDNILGGLSKNAAMAFIKGGLGEAAQELPQSMTESFYTNLAVQRNADPTVNPTENIVGQGIEGAILGFGSGGGAGLSGHTIGRALNPKTPQVQQAEEAVNQADEALRNQEFVQQEQNLNQSQEQQGPVEQSFTMPESFVATHQDPVTNDLYQYLTEDKYRDQDGNIWSFDKDELLPNETQPQETQQQPQETQVQPKQQFEKPEFKDTKFDDIRRPVFGEPLYRIIPNTSEEIAVTIPEEVKTAVDSVESGRRIPKHVKAIRDFTQTATPQQLENLNSYQELAKNKVINDNTRKNIERIKQKSIQPVGQPIDDTGTVRADEPSNGETREPLQGIINENSNIGSAVSIQSEELTVLPHLNEQQTNAVLGLEKQTVMPVMKAARENGSKITRDQAKDIVNEIQNQAKQKSGDITQERIEQPKDMVASNVQVETDVDIKQDLINNDLPEIIKTPKSKYIKQQIKDSGIKNGSPGYNDAIDRINQQYEIDIERAYSNLSFDQYRNLPENQGQTENVLRQTHDQLRGEYGADTDANNVIEQKPDDRRNGESDNDVFLSESKNNKIDNLASQIKKDLNLESFVAFEKRNGDIELSSLIVNKEDRKQGKGTKAVNKLIEYADKNNKRIVLTPGIKNDDFGTTSRNRLVKFYKKLGFIESKGRNIDYELGSGKMYRNPSAILKSESPKPTGSTAKEIEALVPAKAKNIVEVVQSVKDLPDNLTGIAKQQELFLGEIVSSSIKNLSNVGFAYSKLIGNISSSETFVKKLNSFFRDRTGSISFNSLEPSIVQSANYSPVGLSSLFGDINITKTALKQRNDLFSVISNFFRSMDTSSDKSLPYRTLMYAHFFSNLRNSDTFIKHGYSGLDVPSQRIVQDVMISLIHDSKIRNSIIKLIPVDMVNMLTSGKLSSNKFLHNESMLKDMLSLDSNHSVSVFGDIANAFIDVVTFSATKYSATFSDLTRKFGNNFSAVNTGVSVHNNKRVSTGSSSDIISKLSRAQGLYDNKTNKIYLIADHLNKNNFKGVLLHEAMHKLEMTDKVMTSQLQEINKQLQDRFKLAKYGKGTPIERDAYLRVKQANVPEKYEIHEFKSYLVELYNTKPKSFIGTIRKIITDLIASIRAALIRFGIVPKNITAADLNALAKYGLRDTQIVKDSNKSLPSIKDRIESLKNLGFDVNTKYYHGTNKDIKSFKGFAHWFSTDKEFASNYAETKGETPEGANVIPAYLKYENPFNADELNESNNTIDDFVSEMKNQSETFDDQYIEEQLQIINESQLDNNKKFKPQDFWFENDKHFSSEGISAIKDLIKHFGFDSISFTESGFETIGILDSNQVRSVNAKGDISKAESGDLLASEAPRGFNDVPEEKLAVLDKIGSPPKDKNLNKIKQEYQKHKYLWQVKLRQGILDKYESFKSVLHDKESWMMANLASSASGAVESVIESGSIFLDSSGAIDVNTDRNSLAQVLEPLGDEVNRFLAWIAGNRSKRLMEEGRERLFSEDEINDLISFADGEKDGKPRVNLYNKIRIELERLNNDVVQIGVDTGLISKEDAKLWKEQGFYVPFYRLLDDSNEKHSGPRSVSALVGQEAYKKLKGADIPLNDLLPNILMNWTHIIGASLKNQAATKALQTAEKIGIAKKVSPKLKTGERRIFTRENGGKRWWIVDDTQEGRLVLDSLVAMSYDGLNTTAMKVMGKFKRMLTFGVTLSPEFKVANLLRDSIQAMAVSPISKNLISNLNKGIKYTAKDSKVKARMIASGGAFGDSGYIYGADPSAIETLLEKGVERNTILDSRHSWKRLFDAYQDLGSRSENINRAVVFAQVMNKTDNLLQAAFEARDLLDFNRQGNFLIVRTMSRIVPFLNARLQGLDKLGRSFADEKQRKQAISVIAVYGALSSLLYFGMKDDEDYQNAEQWERDTYHLFKIPGSDLMYRFPRPFEVGALANMLERGVEQLVDDKVHGELIAERAKHAIFETFAFNPTPQVVKPLIEVWANKNSFTGRDIEPYFMKGNVSKPNIQKEWTSQTAIALSGAMDKIPWDDVKLSPVQVDHLIHGYFGWAGATTLKAIDFITSPLSDKGEKPEKQIQDYPLIGRFVREPNTHNSRFITEFYENQEKLNKIFGDIKLYRETQQFDKYNEAIEKNKDNKAIRTIYNRYGRRLSSINKQIRAIKIDKQMTGEVKRQKIDNLNIQRSKYAKDIVERFDLDLD